MPIPQRMPGQEEFLHGGGKLSCRSGWEEAEGLGLAEERAGLGGGVLGCGEQGGSRRNASSLRYPRAESRLPPQPHVVVLRAPAWLRRCHVPHGGAGLWDVAASVPAGLRLRGLASNHQIAPKLRSELC